MSNNSFLANFGFFNTNDSENIQLDELSDQNQISPKIKSFPTHYDEKQTNQRIETPSIKNYSTKTGPRRGKKFEPDRSIPVFSISKRFYCSVLQ